MGIEIAKFNCQPGNEANETILAQIQGRIQDRSAAEKDNEVAEGIGR